jgi:hypothetical protein
VLQYPNLYLPLVALALVRLRDRPDARRAVALAAAFGAGIFSAYYASVMLGLTAVVWGLAELARRGPGRLRFFVFAVGAGAAAPGRSRPARWPARRDARRRSAGDRPPRRSSPVSGCSAPVRGCLPPQACSGARRVTGGGPLGGRRCRAGGRARS